MYLVCSVTALYCIVLFWFLSGSHRTLFVSSIQSIVDCCSSSCSFWYKCSVLLICCAGLTVAAKTTNTGQRWGTVMMYSCDCYPQGAVAPVTYLWQPEASHSNTDDSSGQSNAQQTEIRVLWLWCHPASYEEVWSNLRKACSQSSLAHSGHGQENEAPEQRGGNVSLPPGGTEERIGLVHLCSLKDQLIKFRLTGPASNLVLSETLQMADISSVKENQQGIATDRADGTETRWWQEYYSREERKSQFELQANGWERVTKCQSPDELPPRAVLALTVRDPRVLLPSTRTKVALDKAGKRSWSISNFPYPW